MNTTIPTHGISGGRTRRYGIGFGNRFFGQCLAVTVLLVAGWPQRGAGQQLDTTFAQRMQQVIQAERLKWNQHGISAAVIVPGSGSWKGTDGESAAGIPVTDTMLFGAGSVTKTFTSALILQLAEEGKLSLADPLHRWLPGYANVDSTITIRRLLAHTSGVYNFTDNPAWGDSLFADPGRVWKPDEIARYFIEAPSFSQGRSWGYSNTGYLLLGMIAEKASGSALASEFRKRFLGPLALRSTFLEPDEEVQGELVHPWSDFTGEGEPDDIFSFPRQAIYSSAWAAGAIVSTPSDIAAWGSALYGGRILHDSSMARLLTILSLNTGSPVTGYGLGVFRYMLGGKTLYGHGGNVFGYSTSLLHDPEKGITVAVMVNGNMKADEIGYALMTEVMKGSTSTAGYTPASPLLSLGDITIDRSGTAVLVEYSLPVAGSASITLHDLLGREVAAISGLEHEAGTWSATLRTAGLPHGAYICRLQSGGTSTTKKMIF